MAGATGPGALDEGRNRRRVILAVVPWVLAAVLGLLSMVSARGTPTPPTTTVTPAPDHTAATGSTHDAEPTPAPSPASVRAAATEQLDPEVELAVLLAARNAMGAAGLTGNDGIDDRWALDARLGAVEEVTAEYAVATVHGLVLDQDDQGWNGPHPRTVAVLLRTTPSPAVVGDAWPLPPPALPAATPQLRPIDDPDPSIIAPLTDAGWSIEDVMAVETSDDALLRVALQGTPPGGSRAAQHVLWLLDAPGGPRLLPLTTTTDDEDLP